ncbi:Crp/Fnr family transcriptional regulator [Neorhizobium lilium]|nr:Crp/Fnr family transcriptional regulator [Neorhizobium lilium]
MSFTDNTLLARLRQEELQVFASALERIELARGENLHEPFQPIGFVYFFESGLSSEIARNPQGKGIEVGCVGREGFSGLPLVLGVDRSPHHSFIQADAVAWRISATELHKAMEASPPLAKLLFRYIHVFMIQIASAALADGRYGVQQRLARWLLMSQDRLGNELPLTHDFLGLMLGVRRPSVTDALHLLEGKHLIKAERGLITVRDRKGLEELAGDAYGVPEAEYRRLILEA